MMIKDLSKRRQIEMIRTQLESERSSFIAHWRDVSDHIMPRRQRFSTSDTNKGDKRNQRIYDNTATLALRTLRSGMMSGVTSPARPWFKLSLADNDMAKFGPVRSWLDEVSERMGSVFIKSNLYNVLPICYGDIGGFGTHAMYMEPDLNSVVRFYPFAVGSYSISNNEKLMVDTFHREFRMTVRQLIGKFGIDQATRKIDWSKFSSSIRSMFEAGQLENWIDVEHMILPNMEYDPRKALSKFKKYSSFYYESGKGGRTADINIDSDTFLRNSGYDYFPILAPRWEVNGEDVYGTNCPAFEALGDVKQLQTGTKRGLQAIEKMVNPPMVAPISMQNQRSSILAGDITYVDERSQGQGFRAAHEINFRLGELENYQAQTRDRIRRAFFEDLFLMLANSDRRQITAREIEERHEEKLLALGPVLEQLNQDLLDPLIDNTYLIMEQQGLIPPPPEELQGQELKVEYISIMAQAQKLVGLGGIERFSGFVGNIAGIDPSVLDKIDNDQLIDVYADLTSVPAKILRNKEQVEEIRAAKAKAQAQAAQAEQMKMASSSMKDLGQTNIEQDTALGALLDSAQAGQIQPQAIGV